MILILLLCDDIELNPGPVSNCDLCKKKNVETKLSMGDGLLCNDCLRHSEKARQSDQKQTKIQLNPNADITFPKNGTKRSTDFESVEIFYNICTGDKIPTNHPSSYVKHSIQHHTTKFRPQTTPLHHSSSLFIIKYTSNLGQIKITTSIGSISRAKRKSRGNRN